MVMNLQKLRRTMIAVAVFAPLLQACESGSSNLATIGAIDTSTFFSSVAPPPPAPVEETVDPNQPVFSRTGLEDILGYNKISWTYLGGTVPTVEELYFFVDAEIISNAEQQPMIQQTFADGSGAVLVLYLEAPSGLSLHSLARLYSDGSVVVHMFERKGAVTSNGLFVYCYSIASSDPPMETWSMSTRLRRCRSVRPVKSAIPPM